MLSDFVAYVKADGAVASLIVDRMEPGVLSEASPLPALTYTDLSTPRDHYLSGVFDGFLPTHLEIECWGVSAAAASLLSAKLIAAIDGFSGTMGGTHVHGILVEDESDRTRQVYGDRKQYCRVLDVLIMHAQPLPG